MVVKPQLVYITSQVRSGSTVLEHLLASWPGTVGLGELARLDQHLTQGLTCGCGALAADCEWWSKVLANAGVAAAGPTRTRRRGGPIGLPALADLVPFAPRRVAALMAQRVPRVRSARVAAERCWAVVDAAASIEDAPIVVDSSKRPEQAAWLARVRPDDLVVVHVIRDGRAVARSMVRRSGMSFAAASASWAATNLGALLLRFVVRRDRLVTLRYEEICDDPAAACDRVARALGLAVPGATPTLEGRSHELGGSPAAAGWNGSQIVRDDRWREEITRRNRLTFAAVGGVLNRALGYR